MVIPDHCIFMSMDVDRHVQKAAMFELMLYVLEIRKSIRLGCILWC